MERPHWDRIQEIYCSALTKSLLERPSFVAQACEQNPALIHHVSLMLQTADSIRGFLEKPLFELGLRIIGAHDSPVLIGTTIDSRYLVEAELGRGGIGAVYLARDLQLHGRSVVIKILLQSSLQDSYVVRKFKHEVEALARVNHPGVVGLLGAGELEDGKPYLVMQYVNGPTLRSQITNNGMALNRVASIVRQLGVALDEIHAKGILHRDLKPENIMLEQLNDGSELVKIVDFGIAKVNDSIVDSRTSRRTTLGTILYSSPEHVRGDRLSVASDVFSLGVIAYEMLTGVRPFNPANAVQLVEMQRAGVRLVRAGLTTQAERVILKALAFAPLSRHRSAGKFAERLVHALNSRSESERRRRRLLEGSLAAVVCTAALLGISKKKFSNCD